jgi:hypothetical protein
MKDVLERIGITSIDDIKEGRNIEIFERTF